MEVPHYVPRNYHCDNCNEHHPVSIGNETDLARFRDKFIVKCGGYYIARWVSNLRAMVPLNPPVHLPVYRRGYPRHHGLVALLDPPAPRAALPHPHPVNQPLPRRVTISLDVFNNHVTYRTVDVLRGEFSLALLDRQSLATLHYHDLCPQSLQVRDGDEYTYLGDRTIILPPNVVHISLRGRSRLFPFRFARDMADAFATFEAYCALHPDSSPIDAFHYAFPHIDWPGDNVFFDAQLDWQVVTPQLRRDCANDVYTDDYLWDRVRGAAAEHWRLGALRGPPPGVIVKQEPGSAPNPLKRKREGSAESRAVKQKRRGSSMAPIIIDSDDDTPVIEIDD